MRYDYRCDECQDVREFIFGMREKPETVPCGRCSGQCHSVISADVEVLARPDHREYAVKNRAFPICGTPDGQERRYAQMLGENKKLAQQHVRSKTKHSKRIRMLGQIPREQFVAGNSQYGKGYWLDKPKERLKENGLLFTD